MGVVLNVTFKSLLNGAEKKPKTVTCSFFTGQDQLMGKIKSVSVKYRQVH